MLISFLRYNTDEKSKLCNSSEQDSRNGLDIIARAFLTRKPPHAHTHLSQLKINLHKHTKTCLRGIIQAEAQYYPYINMFHNGSHVSMEAVMHKQCRQVIPPRARWLEVQKCTQSIEPLFS